MASYREYRMSWYATFSATALEHDPAKIAAAGSQAAADLRAGLASYVDQWRTAFGEDFTDDEMDTITEAAVDGLSRAVGVGEAVTHG